MQRTSPGGTAAEADGRTREIRREAMEINVAIGGGQKMTLSGAVLVYQGGRETFAAWHHVKTAPTNGAPSLGEAEPLTMEFLRTLSTGLGVCVAAEILPASVLA